MGVEASKAKILILSSRCRRKIAFYNRGRLRHEFKPFLLPLVRNNTEVPPVPIFIQNIQVLFRMFITLHFKKINGVLCFAALKPEKGDRSIIGKRSVLNMS